MNLLRVQDPWEKKLPASPVRIRGDDILNKLDNTVREAVNWLLEGFPRGFD